jgi:hypothetical protein
MDWPGTDSLTITSLKKGEETVSEIEEVALLGYGSADWKRSEKGLTISLPCEAPSRFASCFKISLK